MADNSTEA